MKAKKLYYFLGFFNTSNNRIFDISQVFYILSIRSDVHKNVLLYIKMYTIGIPSVIIPYFLINRESVESDPIFRFLGIPMFYLTITAFHESS